MLLIDFWRSFCGLLDLLKVLARLMGYCCCTFICCYWSTSSTAWMPPPELLPWSSKPLALYMECYLIHVFTLIPWWN